MFENAEAFNQYIGDWDTRNVQEIYSIFKNAKSFNQSVEHWDLSSATYMTDMFKGSSYSHPIPVKQNK